MQPTPKVISSKYTIKEGKQAPHFAARTASALRFKTRIASSSVTPLNTRTINQISSILHVNPAILKPRLPPGLEPTRMHIAVPWTPDGRRRSRCRFLSKKYRNKEQHDRGQVEIAAEITCPMLRLATAASNRITCGSRQKSRAGLCRSSVQKEQSGRSNRPNGKRHEVDDVPVATKLV